MAWRWLTGNLWRPALVLLALALSAPAAAAPRAVDPGRFCTLTSDTPLDPYALLEGPGRFDCATDPTKVTGRYTYRLFTGLSLANDPADPWELRHEYSQADAQSVFVRYANGATIQAPSDRRSARRVFSPGMVSYALPPERGAIVAVLVRVENLRNQRGVAPGAEFKTGQAARDGDLPVLLLYGVRAGTLGALLIYNFALFVSLRYTFILYYCLSALAMLGMGLARVGWHIPAASRPRQHRADFAGYVRDGSGAGGVGSFHQKLYRTRPPARAHVKCDDDRSPRRPRLVSRTLG